MNENWKFSDIPYTRPDVDALQSRYNELTSRARRASCAEELLQIVRERDALQQEVGLLQSIITIRAFHDVTDGFYQTEFQETLPRLETLDSQSLSIAILENPYASALDEIFEKIRICSPSTPAIPAALWKSSACTKQPASFSTSVTRRTSSGTASPLERRRGKHRATM